MTPFTLSYICYSYGAMSDMKACNFCVFCNNAFGAHKHTKLFMLQNKCLCCIWWMFVIQDHSVYISQGRSVDRMWGCQMFINACIFFLLLLEQVLVHSQSISIQSPQHVHPYIQAHMYTYTNLWIPVCRDLCIHFFIINVFFLVKPQYACFNWSLF